MERRYLGYTEILQKAKPNVDVSNVNKQNVKCSRIILLDSELKLQLDPTHLYEKPRNNLLELCTKQNNHTVLDSHDHSPLTKTNKKPKVNFVNFIDSSKVQSGKNNDDDVSVNKKFVQVSLKEVSSETLSLESITMASNSSVSVQDRILETSNNTVIENSKPSLKLVPITVKKFPFKMIKPTTSVNQDPLTSIQPKITIDKPKITIDQVYFTPTKNVQGHIVPLEVEAKSLKSTETPPAHSASSSLIECTNITKVLNERNLFHKEPALQRIIKLRPLTLNAFKSSQTNKKQQLSNILKKVIKNNVPNELQASSSKEVFPVALKSIDHDNVEVNSEHQSDEQILGI